MSSQNPKENRVNVDLKLTPGMEEWIFEHINKSNDKPCFGNKGVVADDLTISCKKCGNEGVVLDIES